MLQKDLKAASEQVTSLEHQLEAAALEKLAASSQTAAIKQQLGSMETELADARKKMQTDAEVLMA